MRVNFGVIGTSNITDWFLEGALKDERFNLYGVYSRKLESGKKFIEKYDENVKVFDDLDEMLKDENIHAVYIASPNSFHYEQSTKALKYNKAVLCEKAFASNFREANKVIELAKEKNVLVMEAMRSTVLPNFLKVKENLHKIGKVRRYSGIFCQYSSRYDKFKEGIILNAFKKELSNGALMDIGVYCLHPMVALFGMPKEINAQGIFLSTGVDGQGTGIFQYEDMEAVINFSKITNSFIPSEIQGEKGSIIIDKITGFNNVKIIYNTGVEEIISEGQDESNFIYEVKEFIDIYENNEIESKLNSHKNTLEVMKIMDEMRRKMKLEFPSDCN